MSTHLLDPPQAKHATIKDCSVMSPQRVCVADARTLREHLSGAGSPSRSSGGAGGLVCTAFCGDSNVGLPHAPGSVYEGVEVVVEEGWAAVGDFFGKRVAVGSLYGKGTGPERI